MAGPGADVGVFRRGLQDCGQLGLKFTKFLLIAVALSVPWWAARSADIIFLRWAEQVRFVDFK